MRLDEISSEVLANYKKAAGKDASKADKEGDINRGNKRFRGIVKATKKQFDNDKNNMDKQKLKELDSPSRMPTEEEMNQAYLNLEKTSFPAYHKLEKEFIRLIKGGHISREHVENIIQNLPDDWDKNYYRSRFDL